jgi:hypothetical protein
VADKTGIEIGGPSGIFNSGGYMPIYSHIKTLDGVNFGNETIWEGELKEGNFFQYENKTYTIQANYSSSCNNSPCNQTGDTAYILVNENNPQGSIFLTLFLILLIFPLVATV